MKISTLNKLVLGVSFVAMMGVVTPEHAQAGFKWKSAPKAEAPAPQMQEENLMEPVIVEDPIDWKGEEVKETVPMSSPVADVAAEEIVEQPAAETVMTELPVVEEQEAAVEMEAEAVVETPAEVAVAVEEANDVVEAAAEEVIEAAEEMTPVVAEEEVKEDMMAPVAIAEEVAVEEMPMVVEEETAPVAEEAPVVAENAPVAMEDEARIVVIGVENGDMLEGFGNDLSLIIALRQIVPAKYQFAFGKNVDLGQKVSWSGDKPWGHVLAEVLYPLDLMAELKGNILTIGQYRKQAPVVAPEMETVAEAAVVEDTQEMAEVEPAPVMEEKEMPELTGNGDDMRVLAEQVAASEDAQDVVYEEAAPIALSTEANPVNMMDIASAATKEDAPMETAAVETAEESKLWTASSGDMLSVVLDRWSKDAGIDLLWTIDYDYVIQSDLTVEGGIQEGAAELFAMFENANPQPYARLHQEEDGQVLIVKVYEAAE